LYLEFAEMVDLGVSEDTLKDAKKRGANSWVFAKDPDDKRKVLIQYSTLKPKYQEQIIKKYGDPAEYTRNQVIKRFLQMDVKAVDHFFNYSTDDGQTLPPEKQRQYVTCANWLNLLIEIDNNWGKYKKELGMDAKPKLYDAVVRIFEAEVIKLPKAYAPLKAKIRAYETERYDCLISKKLGNTNSKKVKDDLNTAILIEMLAHGTQFDDTFIALRYNKVAERAGYKTITAVTVGNYRRANAVLIDSYRKGNAEWYNKHGKIIHQDRASAPLFMINSDDNDLDLYFQNVKLNKAGQKIIDYYYRPVLYVVTDAYNDYILGYAIGDSATTDLVHKAYLNAAQHVYELTGDYYLWQQIKTDHWNLKVLKGYFEDQAKFTPAAAKNARGKIIEQSFGHHWHSTLKELYPKNYNGNNITAKSKLNRDAIELNKRFFPVKDQATNDVCRFIEQMRLIPGKSGKTRQQEWIDAFNALQQDKKRVITPERHFALFGIEHRHPKTGKLETNTITNAGLTVTINGQKLIYEVPKELYLDTLGLTVKVKYNPYNLNSVMAMSEDEKTRVVCYQYNNIPMAIADYKPGDRLRLNSALDEKKGHVNFVATNKEQRQATLKRAGLDAEGLLQAGVLVKELKHVAERQLNAGNTDDEGFDMYDLM